MKPIAPMCPAGFPDSLREPSDRFDAPLLPSSSGCGRFGAATISPPPDEVVHDDFTNFGIRRPGGRVGMRHILWVPREVGTGRAT
jgi:hypothetical protein